MQRQDSLTDQMKTILDLAIKAGCYDAADWLKRIYFGYDPYGFPETKETEESNG